MLLGHHSISQSPARFLKPTTGKFNHWCFFFSFYFDKLTKLSHKRCLGRGEQSQLLLVQLCSIINNFWIVFWLNHWITENWNTANCCVFNRCTFFVESPFFVVYRWVHVTSHQASPRPYPPTRLVGGPTGDGCECQSFGLWGRVSPRVCAGWNWVTVDSSLEIRWKCIILHNSLGYW